VLHLPSLAGLFIYSSHGKCPFPTFQWSFSHNSHFYKLSRSKVAVGDHHSCLLWLACLSSVRDCPSPTLVLKAPRPLWYVSFFVVVYYSVWFFFSFFPGWGSVCPGGYADLAQGCLWEYRVPLSSPGGLLLLCQITQSKYHFFFAFLLRQECHSHNEDIIDVEEIFTMAKTYVYEMFPCWKCNNFNTR
jgi:hypothetical protein